MATSENDKKTTETTQGKMKDFLKELAGETLKWLLLAISLAGILTWGFILIGWMSYEGADALGSATTGFMALMALVGQVATSRLFYRRGLFPKAVTRYIERINAK